MEKEHIAILPSYNDAVRPWADRRRRRRVFRLFAVALISYFAYYAYRISNNTTVASPWLAVHKLQEDYATCATLRRIPANTTSSRDTNKRWVKGTKPTLIRNATIWTGEPVVGTSEEDARLGKGYGWIPSDVLIDRGLIIKIKKSISIEDLPEGTEIFEAHGRRLTAGIVDMHSHAGLGGFANLGDDTNELSSDITPYVRSIDGLDPIQPEIGFIKSGGVTTSLILPGSGNNIGGEAFVIKLAVGNSSGRAEISQNDLFADPDKNWRYLKMACGENAKSVYGKYGERGPFSRLGEAWEFRHALEQAQEYVQEQDEWCAAADALGYKKMTSHLPQKLQWETLGAVLRGQVRVNTHCYTIADLEAYVRLTNQFKFRVYAFHHAHQTYLVPEVLKRAWGGTPAAALFADNMYYKVEAYTASEKAGKILYENGITPTYVSDNPVLNSQHVVFEAAKAYGHGLPYHVALAGVTSASAELLGLGDQVGKIKEGFDADIVVWDSDPLSVGATPVQVWIDGALQFQDAFELKKPELSSTTVLDPLDDDIKMEEVKGNVVFTGVSQVYVDGKVTAFASKATVIIEKGKITCTGSCTASFSIAKERKTPIITLKDGHITPPFTAFGTGLGFIEIDAEGDTHDGRPPNDDLTRAIHGLQFGGKQLATAWKHGVTQAISAPNTGSIDGKGVSARFSTGAAHSLSPNAILSPEVALHYPLTLSGKDSKTSLSATITSLRRKLVSAIDSLTIPEGSTNMKKKYDEDWYLTHVVNGSLPLVLSVHSADTIATLIRLKSEITALTSKEFQLVLLGGAESHILATELAAAKIPVILAPLLPHAQSWDQRRGLTGAPLTNGTGINVLLDAGVLLGISVEEIWESRDLALLAGIAWKNSEGRLSWQEAVDLVGGNFAKIIGEEGKKESVADEWVAWDGNPLEIGARVRGIGEKEKVHIWV
ncbi:amidohydrolase [Dendryphion nanum]|uniref:Amidohydrolase n=1 Tax=Dendryphion nanum TaxID=256645 RepID=A0A9P9IY71_9PLEO|nr:amidohydrolase [Dendryphion nanum]